MKKILVVLIASFVECVFFVEGRIVLKLGENCFNNIECQHKDPNSQCSPTYDQQYRKISRCICRFNYHIIVVNYTERCVFGEPVDEDTDGLTAAPIILCFMICIVVEALCLLVFRYWKKHRAPVNRQTLHLGAYPLSETRISHHTPNGPIISFMLSPQIDNIISDAMTSSPPPYSQAQNEETAGSIQVEEPPPSYEDAMKQCLGSVSVTPVDQEKNCRRKLSY